MVKNRLLLLISIVTLSGYSTAHAASGGFKVGDALVFPDGTTLQSAPKDGKSILHGSGAPTIVGKVGDFYLDTAASVLYGPYAGSWGAGISLVGAKGSKGDTGPQGVQGIQGPAGTGTTPSGTSTVATIPTYVLNDNWKAVPTASTEVNQILSFYAPGGNILAGLGKGNIGIQFYSNGVVAFYFTHSQANGSLDTSFIIGGGNWKSTTINGKPAILVNTSSIKDYGMSDVYFSEGNGYILVGDVLPGPATPMPQTALFTAGMLSNKTISLPMPSGTVTALLASNGLASGSDPSGNAFSNMPWSINGDGTLRLSSVSLKIVGGAANAWTVTYINTKYLGSPTELGPLALTIY